MGRWQRDFLTGLAAGLLVGLFLIPPVVAHAADLVPLGNRIPASHQPAPAPAGFVSFCIRFASQCATNRQEPNRAAMTASLWGELESVNDDVNQAIVPEDDLPHYGRAEYWTIPTDGKGDCEDYALTKRARLIALGVSERALRVAVVKTANGEGHAVLTVATDHGDYVLDNLVGMVRSWDNTTYQWIERQDPDDLTQWVALSPVSQSPALVAAHGG